LCNEMSAPTAFLTRVESFSASHRLHSEKLSKKENEEIFGKCNNPNGHGHNYKVEVTIKGPINSVTGMVMNLTDVKEIIKKGIMDPFDHRNLDQDVPHFKNLVSTTENLSVVIWNNVVAELTSWKQNQKESLNLERIQLYEIKIHETDKNMVTYRGD